MKVKLEEFKKDVLKRLEDDTYDVVIIDYKEKEIKSYKYCNVERIMIFIVDYALAEQENEELWIDVIMYKGFIRIKTKEQGFISIDLSIKP